MRPALQSAEAIPFPKKQPSRLELLVAIEDEIRKQKTPSALGLFAVNDTAKLIGFGQAFFFRATKRGRMRLSMASSLPDIERQSPFTPDIEKAVQGRGAAEALAITIADYPLRYGFWCPLADARGKPFGGLLFTRGEPWQDHERLIADRVSGTIAHAFRTLTPPSRLRSLAPPKWLWLGVPLIAAALFFIPVPMTALAPFEVIADDPVIVAAPLDGVIASIAADPNTEIARGAPLFAFETTDLKAKADVALKREWVAEAKLATARQASFGSMDAKRDLAVTEKELELARAERTYTDELLARADVRAPEGGLLIYSAKSDLMGRPVATGERIMEIADPSRIAFRLDLALADSIAIRNGAKVRIFLDSDPLNIREAQVREASFHALEQPGGGMAFRVIAVLKEKGPPPRIGVRGTAQIVGEGTSLGFYVFRRPIAAVRQRLGL
jgi:HlyD family secretion protein